MNKYYLKLTSFVALFAMCVAILPAQADGVTLDRGTGEIGPANVGSDGFATTTVSWTTTNDYPANTQIHITIDWSDTGIGSSTNLGACSDTTAFGVNGSYSGATPSQIVFTLDSAVASSTYGGVCVRVPVAMAGGGLYTGNFSFSILTSNAHADYGMVEFYVNGGNDVLVDASVQPTLEFAIVDSANLALEKHDCHLGTLSPTAVNTCDYRLKVSTNSDKGFSVTIESDKKLSTASYATLTSIAEDSTVTAGTEGYGIAVTGATIGGNNGSGSYTLPIEERGDFDDDDTPIPESDTVILSFDNSFIGSSTQSTTLITHRASMDAGTVVGYYQHTVTYRVSTDF